MCRVWEVVDKDGDELEVIFENATDESGNVFISTDKTSCCEFDNVESVSKLMKILTEVEALMREREDV